MDSIYTDVSSQPRWHQLEPEVVCRMLETSVQGLSRQEAGQRLGRYGANRLEDTVRRNPVKRFLGYFHDVLIYVLLASALVTALLAHWVDTGVILGVVVVNAIIGFIQEGKAEKALDAIRNMLSPQAVVRRAGQYLTVSAEDLVPGDIVQLQSGDRVPADLRLLRVKNLQIDEAILTGESLPVAKQLEAITADAPLGDRFCMAYSGTYVTYGQATGLVVGTGNITEIGRISRLLERVEPLTTPLLRQMAHFGRWLTVAIVAIAIMTFVFGVVIHGYTLTEMFLAAVGIAVAAIPEGLPAIMTITLAIGVQRMASRRAIIRRLPAVETLGSVSVICTDKTGTLTRNEMTVRSVVTAMDQFAVSGVGYDPHGAFTLDDAEPGKNNGLSSAGQDPEIEVQDYPVLMELIQAGLLCNDAHLQDHQGHWDLLGDPTEGALLTLAVKSGLDLALERTKWPRTDVVPFESEHRFMASLHHDQRGHGFAYVKGAPERILEMCVGQRMRGEDSLIEADFWQQQIDRLAGDGQRVLAIAFKSMGAGHRQLGFADLETGLTLLGLVGMLDPPREDAVAAVQLCQSAGIRVKMITGDHVATALAIGHQMGIGDGRLALSGPELEALDHLDLQAAVERVDIFARSSPEHKLRLVEAMQANGHVVAMTGDGVNDAPALKRADVGTAMGLKGTEVAKQAAEMVLADDNFASIAHAVEEGRTVYDNLKKAILFIMPTSVGEALTIIAAILLGTTLPISPVQILWVNMITAVTLALTLAFEPAEKAVMQRRPRDPREALLTPLFVWRIGFVSIILVIGTFGLFVWELERGASVEFARTVAVNTLVMFEIFYLLNSRYILASVCNRQGLLGNGYALMAIAVLLVFQLAFTYLGPMQHLFGTAAIEAATWLRIVLVASSVFFLVEIEKAMVRAYYSRQHGALS